ncbi:hypothetical protein GQX73_g10724 [Xylaria multiplex]|uniref:Cytochrome b-c1 complex subunit 10 n=1 Tax=Xylaria multiplex TaxID=323545 RepID=A0A7C8MI26_9PEZI|nr:hypothetical protein GQX73_g10724 [Xylaria multiplex]
MVFQSPALRAYKSPYGPNVLPDPSKDRETSHEAMRMHNRRLARGRWRANRNTHNRYHYQPQFAGWTVKQVTGLGVKSGAFGGVALFAVIFFASGIPRVQQDILQKIPFIGDHYIKEIPASDNPF